MLFHVLVDNCLHNTGQTVLRRVHSGPPWRRMAKIASLSLRITVCVWVTKERCAKPTLVEKESSKVILNNVEAQVCGVCCREDDTLNAGVDYVDWLQCGI